MLNFKQISEHQQFVLLVLFVCVQFVCLTYVVSCASKKINKNNCTTPYQFPVSYASNYMNIPEDNPMTNEGVELGRYLFYDGHLSGRIEDDSLMSCATCHQQAHSFECGIDNPVFNDGKTFGLTGVPTPHTMMPLINLVWVNEGYMWSGKVSNENKNTYYIGDDSSRVFFMQNIESFVWMMIISPHEAAGNVDKTVNLIRQNPIYPPLFKAAFGDEEINIDRISKAIAQFVRSLVSFDSKFDKFMRGEVNLTDSERRGFFLFTTEKADCFHCHGSPAQPLWTTNLYMNNAKDVDFIDKNDRASVTGNPMDKGKYRVPTLRNIEFTAPYMHDGRYKTLDEVLEFYNSGLKRSPYVDPLMIGVNHGGMFLSQEEIHDLKAFLYTLSDTSFLSNPKYSNPWR